MNNNNDNSYSHKLARGDGESPACNSADDLSPNRAHESHREQRSWSQGLTDLQRYGLAVLSVVIAVAAALLLESLHFRDAALPLLLFAVAISSWYSRTGPAVLAVILSTISLYWYFVEPVRTPYIYPSQIPYFVIFVAFASVISWFATMRRQADGALQEQANLLNLSHDSIFVIDMSGEIRYWNRGAEEQYGWTADQAMGKNVHDLLKTVFPEPLEKLKAEVARTGRWEGEILHTRKDGSQVVVASRWSLRRDNRGAPLAIMETNNDITEGKRAEEARRRSERYLAEAERLTHTGSWADDGTGRPLYWSEELYRIFGLDPQQGLPTREQPLERIHPEDLDKFLQTFLTAVEAKVDAELEYRILLPDGTVKYVHTIGHPVLYAEGEFAELVGTTVDITERKDAEESLRRSQAYLAEAERLTHTGSFAGDSTTKPLYWSEELYRIFGFDPQQGLPTPEQPLQRVHPEDLDTLLQGFARVIQQRVDAEVEYRLVMPDSTIKWVHGIGHPVLNANGEFVEMIGTTVDITERKRAEEERARLHRLETDLAHINRVSIMGELTASIAHEVNQPLSGVVSNGSACLRWMAGDTPNIEEARETARRIVRDGKRAAEIIGRIRALTKRTATPRERLDLNEAIREILPLVGDEAKKKSVTIRTCFADDIFPVLGDRVQLQQVVLNLVMNGFEAMNTVTDRARELLIMSRNTDPDQVEVTVEDSGTGLDPEASARIYDAFYTTKPAGMGMGLSICRSILLAHDGRLWATANQGAGTTFHFVLPKEQETNAELARV